MAINGLGSAGGFDLSKMASNIASRMVKNLDANKDGSIDKKEFVAGLTAKGISADEAGKQFDSIDTKKAGKISQADIESAIKANGGRGGPRPGGPPPGGPPPGGGPGGGQGAGGTGKAGSASTTSSSTTYDAKDLNKDGSVTAEEELIYDLKHPAVASTEQRSTTQNLGNNVNVTA
jgi:hypothetical protein